MLPYQQILRREQVLLSQYLVDKSHLPWTRIVTKISEGSTNLYFTNARSRNSLSVASVSSPEVQLLTYNSAAGAFSVPLSSVFSEFSAGTGLSYADGEYSLDATTSDVSEGSNLYYPTVEFARPCKLEQTLLTPKRQGH